MLKKGYKGVKLLAASAVILGIAVSLPLQAQAQGRDIKNCPVQHEKLSQDQSFQEYRESSVYDIDRARSGWSPAWTPEPATARASTAMKPPDSVGMTTIGICAPIRTGLKPNLWDGWATQSRVDLAKERYSSADSRLFDNAEAAALDTVLGPHPGAATAQDCGPCPSKISSLTKKSWPGSKNAWLPAPQAWPTSPRLRPALPAPTPPWLPTRANWIRPSPTTWPSPAWPPTTSPRWTTPKPRPGLSGDAAEGH